MSPDERRRLVAGYIEHNRLERVWDTDNVLREVKGQDNFWAYEMLSELCRKDPDESWELILTILHTPHPDSVTEVLAAGPLESLLGNFGSKVIARVEERAKTDPLFKDLLGGVWRGHIAEDVWRRVEASRGEPW